MQIVRLSFVKGASNKEYFFDRVYDEEKSPQVNCDEALAFMSNIIKSGEPIACMKYTGNKEKTIVPVILNSRAIDEFTITSVKIYKATEELPNGPTQ